MTRTFEPVSNRFKVALSFPGEHRDFVLKVAEELATRLTRDRVGWRKRDDRVNYNELELTYNLDEAPKAHLPAMMEAPVCFKWKGRDCDGMCLRISSLAQRLVACKI